MLRFFIVVGIVSQFFLACLPKEQVLDKNMVQSSSCLKHIMQVDPTMTYIGSYTEQENGRTNSRTSASVILKHHFFSDSSIHDKVDRFVIVQNMRIPDPKVKFTVPDDYFSDVENYLEKGKIELDGDYYQYLITIQDYRDGQRDEFFKSKSLGLHNLYVVKYLKQWCSEKIYMTIIYGEHLNIDENGPSAEEKLMAFMPAFNKRCLNSISFVGNVN